MERVSLSPRPPSLPPSLFGSFRVSRLLSLSQKRSSRSFSAISDRYIVNIYIVLRDSVLRENLLSRPKFAASSFFFFFFSESIKG